MAKGSSTKGRAVFQNHRRRKEGLPDPYVLKKGLKEPTICPSCHAVYHKKRWYLDEGLYLETKKQKGVSWQKCPADRKIEDGYAMGVVNIIGDFVLNHKDEIINLVRSEERHAMEKNPLENIRNSDSIQYVMLNGRLYDAATMNQVGSHPVKRAPFYWEGGRDPAASEQMMDLD